MSTFDRKSQFGKNTRFGRRKGYGRSKRDSEENVNLNVEDNELNIRKNENWRFERNLRRRKRDRSERK